MLVVVLLVVLLVVALPLASKPPSIMLVTTVLELPQSVEPLKNVPGGAIFAECASTPTHLPSTHALPTGKGGIGGRSVQRRGWPMALQKNTPKEQCAVYERSV